MLGLRKRDLLSYLARSDAADANAVARAFGVHYSIAAMGLLRLVRQGLATRDRAAAQGLYRYRLSERGLSRLQYLERRGHGHNPHHHGEPPKHPLRQQEKRRTLLSFTAQGPAPAPAIPRGAGAFVWI